MFDLLDFSDKTNFTTDINGHKFQCHLLDMGDEMEVGTLSAPYMDTPVLDSVLKCATFALAVDAIDGQPLYEPVLASNAPLAPEKFLTFPDISPRNPSATAVTATITATLTATETTETIRFPRLMFSNLAMGPSS